MERFTEANRFKASEEIGPGSYAVVGQSGFAGKTSKMGNRPTSDKVCFASGQARFAGSMSAKNMGQRGHAQQMSAQKLTTPGPGQYEDGLATSLAEQVRKRTVGNKKAFNCEEKRQPEYNMQETPGPGQYAQN